MSQLAYAADACQGVEEPRILSFLEFAAELSRKGNPAADQRARSEFHNRSCPICSRVTVEPIELRDGRLGRNGRLIPGTGTLVGFSCNGCGHEWPASS